MSQKSQISGSTEIHRERLWDPSPPPLRSLLIEKLLVFQQNLNSIVEKHVFPTNGVLNSTHIKEEEPQTTTHTPDKKKTNFNTPPPNNKSSKKKNHNNT